MEKQHEGIKQFAKNVVNPVMVKFAGAKFSPFAMLQHKGRKSGKTYSTPLVTRRTRKGFVIAMPYGPDVDWYRNASAAGEAVIRFQGRRYLVGKPVHLAREEGLPAFPLVPRFMLSRLNVRDFMLMPVRPAR